MCYPEYLKYSEVAQCSIFRSP